MSDPALDILTDARQWRLSADGWTAVEQALEQFATALGHNDTGARQRALATILLSGPSRVLRAGAADPGLPPPPRIRERINHLVHVLSTDPDADAGRRQSVDGGRDSATGKPGTGPDRDGADPYGH
ncbi:CATRA system-associated protein [Streptomyces sp. NPDC059382]|uniref:CATRA system-associated protein n=1 Tax=Streptomyces sp. NPDC059382 TaxID=3346816 RepID=UPI003675B170